MRKYVIYCLVAVLLIGLVPVGASATEDSDIYEVVIYPNRKDIQTLGDEESLVLGDVEVSYNVDYENNEIDIYFEEPIFIYDVVSEGSTIHRTIKANNDEEIEINEELRTDGFMFAGVSSLQIQYEDINNVEYIKIQSGEEPDFSGGLLDGLPVLYRGEYYYDLTDNNLDTYIEITGDYIGYFILPNAVDIYDSKAYGSYADRLKLEFYDSKGKEIKTKVDGCWKGVKEIRLRRHLTGSAYVLILKEFNVYGIETPPEDVKNLNYTIDNNNITFTWENPTDVNFKEVNIYRDGKLIKTTTDTSFTEVLSPGTYKYKITTTSITGKESPGITLDNIKIEYKSSPTVVKGIRMLNKTATGGLLTWTPNPAYENVSKYVIYLNDEKHGEIEAPPYVLEGLEEGQVYTISVQAINNYGISEPPSTLTYIPKKPELQDTIDVGDVFSNVNTLFANMWPLLALVLAIILSPKIYHLIKSNVT